MISERLLGYYDFSPDVIAAVSDTASWQDKQSFESLTSKYKVESGPTEVCPPGSKKPLEVLRFLPDVDYDEHALDIYHLPMANNISPNMVMRGIRLFGSNPTTPLLMVGNPGSPGSPTGKLTWAEMFQVFRNKDLGPINRGLLQLLEAQGVDKTRHLGYSYGADKAVAATRLSPEYGQTVTNGVLVEPAAVIKRNFAKLAMDFNKSGLLLEDYWQQTDSQAYQAIRQSENYIGLARYVLGLGRLSNLVIENTLIGDGFRQGLQDAIVAQPDIGLAIAWGAESEIGDDDSMLSITKDPML